jgi:hypothetical protein
MAKIEFFFGMEYTAAARTAALSQRVSDARQPELLVLGS